MALPQDGSFDSARRDDGVAGGMGLGGMDAVQWRVAIIKMDRAIVFQATQSHQRRATGRYARTHRSIRQDATAVWLAEWDWGAWMQCNGASPL